MGRGANGYYSLKDIEGLDCTYNILLGGRNLGKSYAVKEKYLKEAYKSDVPIVAYVRRWGDDIKGKLVEQHYADMPIKKITRGEYSTVCYYRGGLYFANIDENYKTVRGRQFGYAFALNEAERVKSTMYPTIRYVVYEEFVTTKFYLKNEPDELQQLVSTIARDNKCKVYMIANTISRTCPYFTHWSLSNVPKMKQGDIDVYEYSEGDSVIKVAVELAPPRANAEDKNSMFFGSAVRSIVKGEWDAREYQHLDRPLSEYAQLWDIDVEFEMFNFKMLLLLDDTQPLLYIYPHTKTLRANRRLTEVYDSDIMHTRYLMRENPAECMMAECWSKGNVAYSDNLTGEDFTGAIKSMDRSYFKLM